MQSIHQNAAAALLVALAGSALSWSQATPAPPTQVVVVGKATFIEGRAEVSHGDGPWLPMAEEQAFAVGDRIRTLAGSTARLELPWTAVSVSDNTLLQIEKTTVLTLRLAHGRVDVDPEQNLPRIATGEASVGGNGRTVVRRDGSTTFVASDAGGAEVEAQGQSTRVPPTSGLVVNTGAPSSQPMPLTDAPRVVTPSADPRYTHPGETVRLTWEGRAPRYHLQVLSVDSDIPVLAIDLNGTSYDLKLGWLGTFRWRVAGLSGPIESQLSAEGLVCVVEK